MYFVMLRHPNAVAVPLVDDNMEIEFFSSYEEAKDAAEGSSLGAHFGYDVFCMGNGEDDHE